MKKRVYFIISSIVQIIFLIYSIVSAREIVKTLISGLEMYPQAMRERMTDLFGNAGPVFVIVMAAIGLFANIFILYCAIKDRLLRSKGGVLGAAIISLFTALNGMVEILSIVNIIVIATSKREKPEDYPNREKREIPQLEKEIVDNKKIILAIVLLVIYFSQQVWGNFLPDSKIISGITIAVFYIVMICLSLYFFRNILKRDFREFKKNFRAYIDYILPKLGIYYLIYFVVALLSMIIVNQATSANQASIEALPIYVSIPLAVIYAPIVEEVLFRGCIRRFINNDKIYIAASAIVFGLLHTIFSETTLFNIIFAALPYAAMGGFLAYIHTKTNNMLSNMSCHAFHNTIAMIISILISGI